MMSCSSPSAPLQVSLLKGATVLLVVVALLLPVLQMRYDLINTDHVTENRKKARRPENAWSLLLPHSTYASDFEKYFNDNFGFRDFLIRIKNQFDYSLFGFSSQVHIGPNKWLFYKGTYEDTALALERLRPQMNKLFTRVRRLRDLLAARGITLVVIPCPMKSTMYQEELPPLHVRSPDFSAFDEYVQFLRDEPGIITIDVENILRPLKQKMQVYHRTDFHWNDPAGAHILLELLDTMEKRAGIPVSEKPSIKIRVEPNTGGGEINSLAVVWPPYEDMLMLESPLYQYSGTYVDGGRVNTWTYTAAPPADPTLLPPTVIFGDSFADAFLRAGFMGRFTELRKFYNLKFKEDFKSIPPNTKFVVIEHIESVIGGMLQDSYWPEELQ
jgi:hypothetical protein